MRTVLLRRITLQQLVHRVLEDTYKGVMVKLKVLHSAGVFFGGSLGFANGASHQSVVKVPVLGRRYVADDRCRIVFVVPAPPNGDGQVLQITSGLLV